MKIDLTEIVYFCSSNSIKYEYIDKNEIHVLCSDEIKIIFANDESDTDNYIGFVGTAWHTHDNLILNTGENNYINLSPVDIILGIIIGDLLIVTSVNNDGVVDRWIVHKSEKFDLSDINSGESFHIKCFAQQVDAPEPATTISPAWLHHTGRPGDL